ncbi:glycosyltransferase [Haliangium sp.]|uniref:glycosyltransferase n=1 Tax=Haliangium sp. TaxID=2663208 RepID=UPI003D0C9D6D
MTDKRICLFPHLGYLSETSRMVAAYKALKAVGVAPLVATHGGTYEWVLKEEGLEYEVIEPVMSNERCQAFVAANRMDGRAGHFYEVDELEELVKAEIDYFERTGIGVVLTGFNLSLGLSARAARVRYCVTHLGSWCPPIFERQMQAPYNYLTERIPRFVPRSWLKKLVNRIYLTSKLMTKPHNVVARRLGIEPVHTTMDMFMGDVTIVTEAPEILGIPREELESWTPQKPANFHANPKLRYAGPMYAKLFGELRDDVRRFLDSDGPVVYVALTSTRPDYLAEAVRTLLELDARLLVVSTVHRLGITADKLMVADHLPSHLVMPMVDLAVIHGGQGSVQTAVASGTPVVGFPLQTEQMFNLDLLEQHGAGINLPLQALRDPARLRAAARTVLEDPSYKANMDELKRLQEAYDGPAEVARILSEELEEAER